jgi:hypothetical protein
MVSLKAGVEQVHAESAGVLDIYVFKPEQVDELIGATLFGDAAAGRLAGLAASTVVKICSAPRKSPAICMCCDRPARRWGTICLVLPHRSDPTSAIGSGLCSQCAAMPAESLDAQIQIAMKQIWPAARVIGRVSKAPEATQ